MRVKVTRRPNQNRKTKTKKKSLVFNGQPFQELPALKQPLGQTQRCAQLIIQFIFSSVVLKDVTASSGRRHISISISVSLFLFLSVSLCLLSFCVCLQENNWKLFIIVVSSSTALSYSPHCPGPHPHPYPLLGLLSASSSTLLQRQNRRQTMRNAFRYMRQSRCVATNPFNSII